MNMQDVVTQYIHEEDMDEASQPQLAIKTLPYHWKLVSLGNVLREVDIRAEDLKIVESERTPVLSLTKNNGLIPQYERFNNRVAIQDISSYKVIKKGQIVYNPFVLWEGAIYALKGREQGLISPAYLVWEAIHANPYFLDFLLRTPLLLKEYLRVASGVVQRRRAVRKDVFLNIRIPLPPSSEQRTIAHILQTVQDAIQARRNEIELERERKAALMQRLFTHGTRNEPTKQSEVGEIPESWEVNNLEDFLLGTQYGLSLAGGSTGAYPILRMNNLVDGSLDYDNFQYVDLEDATLQKFKLNKGDVLFNRTNSNELVGKTSLFNSDRTVVFASYLIRLVTNSKQLRPAFLNWYFNWEATQRRLKTLASRGVSQSNINASKLQRFKVPITTPLEQDEIVDILNTCDSRIASLEKELSLHEELFRALLDELMTGRLSALPLVE